MPYPLWTGPSPAVASHDGDGLRARQASTNTTCLPQSLLSVVPNCAVSCIQTFASQQYPGATCANTSDLTFLCTQPDNAGLTIGEGAVQCVVSFCTGADQADLDVYNICDSIPGALPRTVRTITATIIGSSTSSSSTMENLPATIGTPTTTEDVSTIVMATDSMTWIIETPSATTMSTSTSVPAAGASSSTNTSSVSEQTSGAMAMPDKATRKDGLTTPQLAGIAIGGAALVVIIFALIFLFIWMRRRRRQRRRSQRRSRLVEQTPPPNYQSPQKENPSTFEGINSSLAVPTSHGRFYGSQQPTVEEKRRSFWRKSIKPEEIGVAVSPKIPGDRSPASTSSEESFSLLLPAVPAVALRPAPLNVEATRERRRTIQRPISDATEFDDEPDVQMREPERLTIDDQVFVLEKPPLAKRPRGPPPNLRLPAVPESPPQSASQARIPLTPTYDNGNIEMLSPPRSFGSTATSQPPLPVAERKLPPSSIYANRNVLRKKTPERTVAGDQPVEPLTQPRNAPIPPEMSSGVQPSFTRRSSIPATWRDSSASSAYTEIEEDTTPEEINRQLGLRANPPSPPNVPPMREVPLGRESPIKDLRYPQVPRSAAVSRQAETLAQPRENLASLVPLTQAPTAAPTIRPTRTQLVRAEASFMQTDTTSSDGYQSDSTLEFPIPPSSKPRSVIMTQLRNNPSSGNKGPNPTRGNPSLSEVLASTDTKPVNVTVPQRSPSSKARLTPSKSRSGDLYLTVEI